MLHHVLAPGKHLLMLNSVLQRILCNCLSSYLFIKPLELILALAGHEVINAHSSQEHFQSLSQAIFSTSQITSEYKKQSECVTSFSAIHVCSLCLIFLTFLFAILTYVLDDFNCLFHLNRSDLKFATKLSICTKPILQEGLVDLNDLLVERGSPVRFLMALENTTHVEVRGC